MSHVILFYKYHSLTEDRIVMETYRKAMEDLCRSLDLIGRILIGCSKNEGINGTLAGSQNDLEAFSIALLGGGGSSALDGQIADNRTRERAIEQFRAESATFFHSIGEPDLFFESPEDFKWSTTNSSDPLFPDLNIKLVSELIGTGGKLLNIPLEETSKGYLTPQQWHDRLQQKDASTLLIDCRNTKEHEIGHFSGAIDPMTTTFSQFPKWVEDHKHEMSDKKILMYCTGGIRCEKASAFIRRIVPSAKEVSHLKGGVHKYLEQFGTDNSRQFHGKNFVFDGRLTATNESISAHETVGRCICCKAPFDEFDPKFLCTVCREPLLVCLGCRHVDSEYHCKNHAHLRHCYFSNLSCYGAHELSQQRQELLEYLQQISVGRRYKQKRKTLLKQIARVEATIGELQDNPDPDSLHDRPSVTGVKKFMCRSCGGQNCDGKCWGFHGLTRKRKLEERAPCLSSKLHAELSQSLTCNQEPQHETSSNDKTTKFAKEVCEFACKPPSMYRDKSSGIRVPKLTVRTLRCQTKAKWCGQTPAKILGDQFSEMGRPDVLRHTIDHGLLFLNEAAVSSMSEASEYRLKNGDCISRVAHWHEAPVIVPERLDVQMVELPCGLFGKSESHTNPKSIVYVCNKPSTVPVHPAGPYFVNSLTCMLEGQEGLSPTSLKPIHRIDRATSGLTLCCTDSRIAKAFQRALSRGSAQKLYLARVNGRFPAREDQLHATVDSSIGRFEWRDDDKVILVDAPVHTVDPAAGIRAIDSAGKQATSLFRAAWYDEMSDTSLVECQPITGRNHQLRVHLKWLGFPIVGDIQYGGRKLENNNQVHGSDEEDYTGYALELMLQRVNEARSTQNEQQTEDETDTVEIRARQGCTCCSLKTKKAIVDAFSSTQLLQGGHEIQLHALKYKITLTSSDNSIKETVSFRVCQPSWAVGTGGSCNDRDLDYLAKP